MKSGTHHDPEKMHLFIICTDPCARGLQVIVPIATWTNKLCDSTTILNDGDHPFVNRKSYVLYRKSETVSNDGLIKGIEDGTLKLRDDLSDKIYTEVVSGICVSIHTPKKVKRYLRC